MSNLARSRSYVSYFASYFDDVQCVQVSNINPENTSTISK